MRSILTSGSVRASCNDEWSLTLEWELFVLGHEFVCSLRHHVSMQAVNIVLFLSIKTWMSRVQGDSHVIQVSSLDSVELWNEWQEVSAFLVLREGTIPGSVIINFSQESSLLSLL